MSKILQIYPTRHCNLCCQHCYTFSSPDAHDQLPAALLIAAVGDAAQAGYDEVRLSGGEPLVYSELPELLYAVRANGMYMVLETNGMLLDESAVARLQGLVDRLAISLDGPPAAHNRLRAHPRAFETMAGNLEHLRRARIPFGFSFILTRYNLDELIWAAAFAQEQGACRLEIHALEETGRAAKALPGFRPEAIEATLAFLEAARMQQQVGGGMSIQVDLIHRLGIQIESDSSRDSPLPAPAQALADLISPLVIEPDGWVVPLQYGFKRDWALGNLYTAGLDGMAAEWKRSCLPGFRSLCRQVYALESDPKLGAFCNWLAAVRERSWQAQVAVLSEG